MKSPGVMTDGNLEKVKGLIETKEERTQTDWDKQPNKSVQFRRGHQKGGRKVPMLFFREIEIVQVEYQKRAKLGPHVSEAKGFDTQVKRKDVVIRRAKYQGQEKILSESKLNLE